MASLPATLIAKLPGSRDHVASWRPSSNVCVCRENIYSSVFMNRKRWHEVHPPSSLNALSIFSRHFGPNFFIAQMTEALENAHNPRIVKSHPFPMASISGAPTIPPAHEKQFRIKLFNATPELDFFRHEFRQHGRHHGEDKHRAYTVEEVGDHLYHHVSAFGTLQIRDLISVE